jgi:hypothetical protein
VEIKDLLDRDALWAEAKCRWVRARPAIAPLEAQLQVALSATSDEPNVYWERVLEAFDALEQARQHWGADFEENVAPESIPYAYTAPIRPV